MWGGGGGIGCGGLYVLFLVATDMYIEVGGGGRVSAKVETKRRLTSSALKRRHLSF